ncbi:hypothetical protein J2S43_005310 [Catenuloplanes nepalensis]|uniref:Uncharacterized protein n=1 Tax=Catenuloplanes nepalensis TaxID=587533 RepID=A0ABT9MZC6_9ACTN|nr:hypothetical protein [Catenuloplanes nepalensis]MDP9796798.1 hypothetical protein [Catenuloplanes nepalensis]
MFTRIRVTAAALAIAGALLAAVAPAAATQAAPATGRQVIQLSAAEAASVFKIAPGKPATRVNPAAVEYCFTHAPFDTVFYIPTNTDLFRQTTVTKPCYDRPRLVLTRLTADPTIETLQLNSNVSFGPGFAVDATDNFGNFPARTYVAISTQPFTYCPPDGTPCLGANFNVVAYVYGNGLVDADYYFT